MPDKPISFGVGEGAKAEKMTYGVMQRKWDGIRNALSIFREMHGGLRIEATIDANLLQDIDSPEVCGEGAFEQLHHVMLSAMRYVVNNLDLTLYTLDSGEIPNAFLKFYRRGLEYRPAIWKSREACWEVQESSHSASCRGV